jgi:hypothetical protein
MVTVACPAPSASAVGQNPPFCAVAMRQGYCCPAHATECPLWTVLDDAIHRR